MMDPDIFFLNEIPEELLHYDVVIPGRSGSVNRGYPAIMNMGLTISKPHSEFAKMWLQSEQSFVDEDWNWNCGRKTYKMWERRPQMAVFEPILRMIVCNGRKKCTPNWQPYDEANPMGGVNWQRDVIAIHMSGGNPYRGIDSIINTMNDFKGQVGRLILRAAGRLKDSKGLVP